MCFGCKYGAEDLSQDLLGNWVGMQVSKQMYVSMYTSQGLVVIETAPAVQVFVLT